MSDYEEPNREKLLEISSKMFSSDAFTILELEFLALEFYIYLFCCILRYTLCILYVYRPRFFEKDNLVIGGLSRL